MKDIECVEFLRWCLPRLRYRWEGYRRVRRQVCRRIGRRIAELNLPGTDAYREFLQQDSGEWRVLDGMCRVTISRFYRDRAVFDRLRCVTLPALLTQALRGGEPGLRCWSAGCGAGEEPYTLQIIWRLGVTKGLESPVPLRITATDADEALLERARRAVFPTGSLRETPLDFRDAAFEQTGQGMRLRAEFRQDVMFLRQDIREAMPEGRFHLILCRNLVFTYFEESRQTEMARAMADRLSPGGVLVVGIHESVPADVPGLVQQPGSRGFYDRLPP